MPNHVINIITAPEDVLEALCYQRSPEQLAEANAARDVEQKRINETWAAIAATGQDTGADEPYAIPTIDPTDWLVDFGRLVPEPENLETGGCTGITTPNKDGQAEHADGSLCRYQWNIRNWGTKWNGYSVVRDDKETLKIETAWAHPYPVIEALSRKFPDVEIDVKYADEDLGVNCAHYTILNGQRMMAEDDVLANGDEESDKFAAELWGYDYADLLAERARDAANEALRASREILG